ncbi:hypothetical protein [Tateyamaria omphalii]|uniref:Uncharacterized protein n=1 Tax=Tateyamaria omphalii TaxID=299262 RepID=A0A1P8MV44_9RHOB|nr:hypothetical protein [Tateyamaria omphalii]APX11970.1 hypothetical protein BWR18_10000 [Tateyamaria omphalii]
MPINPDQAHEAATEAVLNALLHVYDNVAADDVRPFAEAIAEATRIAVMHVAANAVTEIGGEGIA